MKSVQTILEEIQPIVVDVLCLEPDEVEPTSRFFEDLGGESIELLELSFRCEQYYGIKMQIQQGIPSADLNTDEEGRLTDEAIELLEDRLGFFDLESFREHRMKNRLSELLTVEAIAHLVHQALVETPAQTNQDPSPQPRSIRVQPEL